MPMGDKQMCIRDSFIPFPEDDPYITLVGGTNLTDQGTGGAWSSETTWNNGSGTGSGGGVSIQYSIPTLSLIHIYRCRLHRLRR